jgi:hypothetical protein
VRVVPEAWKKKHNRRMAPGSKLFVSSGRLQEQTPHQKLSWVPVQVRMVFVVWKLTEEKCQEKKFVLTSRLRIKDNKPEKTVPGSSPGKDILFLVNY